MNIKPIAIAVTLIAIVELELINVIVVVARVCIKSYAILARALKGLLFRD